jgi:acetyl-CoA synthetase
MKEGDIYLQPLLDEASDNSVAEIMDSDPLFILYTLGHRKTERNGTYCRLYGLHSLYLKTYLIMKKTTSLVYGRYCWITGHSYILYGPLLNGATTILKEFHLILILVVLGNYRKT